MRIFIITILSLTITIGAIAQFGSSYKEQYPSPFSQSTNQSSSNPFENNGFIGPRDAQPLAPPPNPGPPDIPIDNGIWILLLAGIGFGIYKLRNKFSTKS